jgi:hypothetical protein
MQIGVPPWTREEAVAALSEFFELYKKRPIANNRAGMKFPHMFATWFMLKKLDPAFVVESGIWQGQSTWLIEQACPKATIVCLDIDLDQRKYVSKTATYFETDISLINKSKLSRDTVLFFDDHQDAYVRVLQSRRWGFDHLVFEDNYPHGYGDCHSLKKAWTDSGLAKRLHDMVNVYAEFPPIIAPPSTRFSTNWDQFDTPDPLITDRNSPFGMDALTYTWICYVRLK